MSRVREDQIIKLAERRDCSRTGSWTEYLTVSRGWEKRYLLAIAEYSVLGLEEDYLDPASGTCTIPARIAGKTVVGVQDGYVIGGDLWLDTNDEGLEIDEPDDPKVVQWLRVHGWDKYVNTDAITKAIISRAECGYAGS